MKSFNEVLGEYENWKASRPEGIDLSLEQWSKIMGPDYQSGFNDNAVKRVSATIDKGLEYTGLPQAGAAVGGLAGKMTDIFVGNQEGRFERVGEAVGRGVPRGIAEVAPFFAGGSGIPLNIARALAAGSSGLNAYTQSDSPWQGVVGAATPLAVARGAMLGERLVGRQLGKAAGLGTDAAIEAARVGTALAPKAALYGGSQAGAFTADVGATVLGEGFEPLASAEYWFGQALGQTAFALPDAVRAAQAINVARKGQLGETVAKPINPMFETQAKKKDLIEQLQTEEKGLESPEIRAFWESGGKQETLGAYVDRLKNEAGQLETAFSLIDQTNLKLQQVPVDSLENLEFVAQNYNGLVEEVKNLAPEYFAELKPITEESIAQNYKRFLDKGLDKEEAAERLGQLVKNSAQFMRRNPQKGILQLVDIFAAKEGYDEQGANALKQAAKNVMALSGLVEDDFDVVRILRDPEEKQVLMGYVKPIEEKTFGLLTDLKEVFPKGSESERSFIFLSTIAHEAFHMLEQQAKGVEQIRKIKETFSSLSVGQRKEMLFGLMNTIRDSGQIETPLSQFIDQASVDPNESAAVWFQLYTTALALGKVKMENLAESSPLTTRVLKSFVNSLNDRFLGTLTAQNLTQVIESKKTKVLDSFDLKGPIQRSPFEIDYFLLREKNPGKVISVVYNKADFDSLDKTKNQIVLVKPQDSALVDAFGTDNYLFEIKGDKKVKVDEEVETYPIPQKPALLELPKKAVAKGFKNLVVYHGSKKPFNVPYFDPKKKGHSTGAADAKLGFFFSEDLLTSQTYASTYPKAIVYQVFLKEKNPKVVEMGGELYDSKVFTNALLDAKKNGFDSVIFKNVDDSNAYAGHKTNIHVVFKPEQIKLADETTFDDNGNPIPLDNRFMLNNKDFRYSFFDKANTSYFAAFNFLGKARITNEIRQNVETLQKDFIRWEQNVETIEKLTAGYDPKTQLIEPFTVQQQDVLNDPKIQKLQFSLFQKNPDLEAMKGSTDISRATKLFGNYGEFIWEWSNKGFETVRKAGALTMALPSFANQQLNYIMNDFLTVNMGGFSESIMNSKDSQLSPDQKRLKESVKLIQGKNKEALNAFNQLALMRNVEMEKRIAKNLPLEMELDSPEVKKVFENFNLTLDEKNAVWRLVKSLEDVQKKLTKTTLDQKKIQNIALVANAILRTPKTNISKADVAFEMSKVLETVIDRNVPPQAVEAAKRQFAATFPRQEGEKETNYQQRLNREFHRQEIPKITAAIENVLLQNQIIPDVQNFTGIIKTALTLHIGKADIANLLEKRLWYTTETRNGKFLITYEKDGVTGAIGAANEKELASYVKLLKEDTGVSNIKWDKMELFKPERLPSAVQTQMLQRLLSLEETVYEEVLQDWTSSGLAAPGISPQDFLRDYLPGQAALAALQQQQKNKFLKTREFKPGREFVDVWDAQLRYWQGLSWSSTIGSIKSLHDMYLQDHSLRTEPQLKKVMDNHINAILDPDSREWVTMKKFAFVYWLALVPSTLPVELSQSFFTLMPEITRQTGDIKKSFALTMEASKDLVEAVKKRGLKPGTYQFSNPLYTKLFDRATRQEGWLESFGAGEDALQESDFINSGRLRLGLSPETASEHLTHWSGQSFNLMRKFYGLATNTNAKLMFLTGIKVAESKGMREETDIYNFARFFAQTTGKLGGKYNRLLAFDLVPKINGPLGFVTTMQNYTFATIAQLVRYGKESLSKDLPVGERKAAQKAFTQMLGTSLFFSGLVGLPFAAAGMRLLEELTGEDVYGLVEEALGDIAGEDEATGKVISDIGMNGLVSRMFGIDLTSRTGLGQVAGLNPYNGFDPWNLGGPTVGAGRSIIQGVEDIIKGDLSKGMESMSPRFLKGVLGQFRNPAEATTPNGQLLTKLSFGEQLATISGFTPKRVADLKNTRQRLEFMDRNANEAKSREMNRLAEAFLEGKNLRETVQGMERRDVLSLVDRIVDKKIPLDLTREVNRANQAEREAFLRRRGAEMQSEVFRLKLRKQVLSTLTGVPVAPTMQELREATLKDQNRQAVFVR